MKWRPASRLRSLLIVGLPAVAALTLAVTDAGRSFDNWLRSERNIARSHDASGQVAVIEIDARSLSRFSQWPWPRSIYAQAVDRLSAAGVDTVAFDVDFSSPSTAAEDARFAEAIGRSTAMVVLPTFRQSATTGAAEIIESLPIPALREHAFLGSVNVFTDTDGLLRRYRAGITTEGVVRPSLASYLSSAGGSVSNDFQIDYAIEPDSLPRHSFADLVEGRLPAAALAGKKVVIGATAIELGDRYATPGHGILPGVTAQALAAETLLQGSTNPSRGPWLGAALALIAALYLAVRSRRLGAIVACAATGAALALLPLLFEHLHLGTLDMAPAAALLATAVLGALVCDTLAAFRATRLTDAETGLPNRAAFISQACPPDAVVVSVTFARSEEISSIIGSASWPVITKLVGRNLSIASGGAQLFRMEVGRYAWIDTRSAQESLTTRLHTAAALFKDPIEIEGQSVLIRPSFGFAPVGDAADAAEAYGRATLAAQRAAQTNSAYLEFDTELGEAASRAQELLADVAAGLAEGQFWAAYQPKLDMRSRTVTGAEALVRWNHPQRGAVRPDEFIPLLESEGQIVAMTWYVVDQVIGDLRAWGEQGLTPNVAINISTRMFEDGHLAEGLMARLEAAGVPAHQLTLEVTESGALGSADVAVQELRRLREAGFKISVDDYGTGQSTLSYLRNFPAHEIKIDQAFIRKMLTDAHDHILVRSTIDLAHALKLSVVAEGIEDELTLDLLRDMGCDVGQGWAIGKPVPADDFITRFRDATRLAS